MKRNLNQCRQWRVNAAGDASATADGLASCNGDTLSPVIGTIQSEIGCYLCNKPTPLFFYIDIISWENLFGTQVAIIHYYPQRGGEVGWHPSGWGEVGFPVILWFLYGIVSAFLRFVNTAPLRHVSIRGGGKRQRRHLLPSAPTVWCSSASLAANWRARCYKFPSVHLFQGSSKCTTNRNCRPWSRCSWRTSSSSSARRKRPSRAHPPQEKPKKSTGAGARSSLHHWEPRAPNWSKSSSSSIRWMWTTTLIP